MVIWKFRLPIEDEARVEMPGGAHVLHVGLDPVGTPCIWALVNPEEQVRAYTFYVIGTARTTPCLRSLLR